jgi:3-oxoacyl-[acyl-carrier protein] reductase
MEQDTSLSLAGRRILVTGVSRSLGIGTAIARRCAQAGAAVAVHGNAAYDTTLQYPDAAHDWTPSFVAGLSAEGLTVVALTPSDLADPAAPAEVVAEAAAQLGGLDGLALNHAYSTHAPLGAWTAEHIDAHLSVNVRAAMLMIQAFAGQIGPTGGAITLFTSGQYLGPMVSEIAYAVSKEAIRGLCTQAAAALAPRYIRVNCINPGPTDTGYLTGLVYDEVTRLFPAGRWGLPDDAARLVQFLHSDHARWITGQTIASEGGFDRYARL